MERVKETLTLKTLIESKQGLDEFAQLRMSIKTSYEIGKFLGKINTPIKTFLDARNKYIQDHGQENEDGYKEIKGDMEILQLQDQMEELLKEEIEVEVPKITLKALEAELDDPDPKKKQKVSPATLTNLSFMIIE